MITQTCSRRAAAPPLFRSNGLFDGAFTLIGFGDSITNNGVYDQPNGPLNATPAWQPGATYAVNNIVYNGTYKYRYVCTTAGTSDSSSMGPANGAFGGTIAGGSSYTTGTYTSVPLTGGSGSNAVATVTVSSGGVVNAVTITTNGKNYQLGDVLSASNSNLGGTGSGFTFTLTQIGFGTAIADGGGALVWQYLKWNVSKALGPGYLTLVEQMSNGRMRWVMGKGYQGPTGSLVKTIVVQGGQNYSPSDTVTYNNGATGTLTVVNGVIVAAPLTNPGHSTTSSFTWAINSATGSGAVLSTVAAPNGANAVSGCTTTDLVARLPDLIATLPGIDAVFVHCGTNDIGLYVTSYATAASVSTTVINN